MKTRQPWRNATALLILSMLSACTVTRPTPPPAGAPVQQPWGAVPIASGSALADESLSDSLVSSMRAKWKNAQAENATEMIPYRALALSGGGSRGAYGAGVLSGWTVHGDRPEFDVVTGISTGALMATHVFLGPEFDEELKIYTRMTNDDVYKKRGLLGIIRSGAAFDTSPLRETLSSFITEEILDRVAAEYRAGRRLFVGSTNLDANLFTVWDLGAIAGSARPDRMQRYIDAVMASASFPIAFQPVYIEVEGEDGTYTQMHADGNIREAAFYFDFAEDLYEAMNLAGLDAEDFTQDFYLLVNGAVAHSRTVVYDPISPRLRDVAAATVDSLMTMVTRGSVFRLWVIAMIGGADFHVSFIPQDFEFETHTLEFEPEEAAELFELGYRQAVEGAAWATQLAPESGDEILEAIAKSGTTFDISARHRTLLERGAND